jgi:glucose-6-phosphate isomerase, archaeal
MNIPETSLIEPFTAELELDQGLLHRAQSHLVRRASDMRGYYADAPALERLIAEQNDPIHYEVFEVPVPAERGQLMSCVSTLLPGLVGEEYFMTKGHYHSVINTAEVYLCLRGEGYMVMKTREGKFAAEKMTRGRMVYVPAFWAHRSVNIGATEPLVSFCVYPAEAGHNYGDIASEGFPKRLFHRQGKCVMDATNTTV